MGSTDGLAHLVGYGLDATIVRDRDAAPFHQQAEPLEGIGQHPRNPVGEAHHDLLVLLRDLEQVAAGTASDHIARILVQAQGEHQQRQREGHATGVLFLEAMEGAEQDQSAEGGVEQVPNFEGALVPALHGATPSTLPRRSRNLGCQ